MAARIATQEFDHGDASADHQEEFTGSAKNPEAWLLAVTHEARFPRGLSIGPQAVNGTSIAAGF